ncbi:MAG TPA: FGGY-family carbohydrate kinase [Candidatus Anoxymicrobiaceae bacterium]
MADLLIGHDVGTGGSKSVLADTDGNLMAGTFQPYEVSYPRPNWAEQDPEDWWRAVSAGTRQLLDETGVDPSRIRGIGFAGQMIGIVPVNAEGELLSHAIVWLDSRADEQAERLIRRLGGKRIFTLIAGALPTGKDVVCKLAWLKEKEPELFSDTHAFLDVTGYMVLRATGEFSMDHSGAGGTGLLDNKTREWSSMLARLVSVPLEKMPPVHRSIDIVGGLTDAAARDMGLVEGTPVIAGMADIPAAATGSGALENGDAHIYLGTSSWLCLSLSKPKNLPKNGIVSVASPDPSMFIMLGESETAGLCLKWFADNLATAAERERAGPDEMAIFAILDEIVAGVKPGAENLVFTPWMFGERSPVGDTTLRASFFNLSLEHRREHLLRAVYEGVAYNLRWMVEEVERHGMPIKSLRAIGGGAKSDIWMHIMADVTGKPVEALACPQEAGALGVALAVAVGLGIFGDYKHIKKILKLRETFQPDPANASRYQELFAAFHDVYPALSKAGRALNEGV